MYRLTAVWQPTDNLDVNFKYSHSEFEKTGSPSTSSIYIDADQREVDVPNRSAFASIGYLLTDEFYPEPLPESKGRGSQGRLAAPIARIFNFQYSRCSHLHPPPRCPRQGFRRSRWID